MAITKFKTKTDGRHGIVAHGNGFSLHFAHDLSFYKVCRYNRAVQMLKDALIEQAMKPRAIDNVLNDPKWAQQYVSALENNETVRECELLTAQMIAKEIVVAVKASAIAADSH